jgi:hypothetical protein
VCFFFPLGPFIKSLYAREDLVPYLFSDSSATVIGAGHVTRSRGFKKKVLDNPKMNADHRNLALVSTTDGVPFFDDQKRGAWPFILRVANLPDGLSTHISNCHLHLLQASEFWEHDKDAGVLRRRVREPKNLQPYLSIITNDLYKAYAKGVKCIDATVPRNMSSRKFRCHCILLYWTGDYPALAKVSGMHDKCCHWCTYKSEPAPEISRRIFRDFRRYLPKDHPLRDYHGGDADNSPRDAELRDPPPLRTHEQMCADGKANEVHGERVLRKEAYKNAAPYKHTGIRTLSALRFLHLFDLKQDILPDMMHILPVIFKGHIFKMFNGSRMPAKVKPRLSWTQAANDKLAEDHEEAKKLVAGWELTKEDGLLMDRRSLALAGEPTWIRSGLEVFTRASSMTAHDWLQMMQFAGDYILEGVTKDTRRLDALFGLVEVVQEICATITPADVDNRDAIGKLKLKLVEALSQLELVRTTQHT